MRPCRSSSWWQAPAPRNRLISRASSSSTLIVPKVRSMRDGHSTLGTTTRHSSIHQPTVAPATKGSRRRAGMARRNRLSRLHSYVPLSSRRCISPRYPTSPHVTIRILPPSEGFSPTGAPRARHTSRTVSLHAALQRRRCSDALPNTCSRPRDELLFPSMHATALRHPQSSPHRPARPARLRPVPARRAPAPAERRAPSRSTRWAWCAGFLLAALASAPGGAGVVVLQLQLAGIAAATVCGARPRARPRRRPAPRRAGPADSSL